MPVPTNLTALTALDVGTLPASITQLVSDAGVCYTVWYKYTADEDAEISMWGYGDTTIYRPQVFVFLSPGTTTRYLGIRTGALPGELTNPANFPVRSGETYLFQINRNSPTASPANLTLTVEKFVEESVIPRESIAINDDAGLLARGDGTFDTFPLVLLSTIDDNTPLRYIQSFPSGETGDCLNDGTSLVGNDNESAALRLVGFDSDFNQLFSNLLSAGLLQDIRANRNINKFFILYYALAPPGHPVIATVLPDGTITDTTSPISTSIGITCLATSPDGTIAYFCDERNPGIIGRWDLINDIALSDLVSSFGNNPSFLRNMLCLSDGSVIIGTVKFDELRRYSAAGALLNTYNAVSLGISTISGADSRLAYSVDSDVFWYRNVEFTPDDGIFYGFFLKIDAATGTVINRIRVPVYSDGTFISNITNPAQLTSRYGFSESCTFWILPVGIGSGTIIVIKETMGGTGEIFDFTAGGGLSPGSFSLSDGESQEFDEVAIGDGYSIVETPLAGWNAAYDVSNDSPINNISVGAGEIVTITVTNSIFGLYSGIYYIKPFKTNDTLYYSITSTGYYPPVVTTTIVAIPNPFIVI